VDVSSDPPLGERERQALSEALIRLGTRADAAPAAYASPWRASGLREATETDEPDDYALSPRSTRGATRA
jgi:hypothetical protein